MEVIFHFVFQLIKIVILASVYASILIGVLLLVRKFLSLQLLDKIKKEVKKYWLAFGLVISVLLFIYSFTYWGNHGLGDAPIIPIGHWKKIENTNWTEYAYLKDVKTTDKNMIETTKFKVADDKLCGNLNSSFYDYNNSYFVLNLKTDKIIEFKTKSEYNEYANGNNIPKSNELLSFEANYRNHWSVIKFLLLP